MMMMEYRNETDMDNLRVDHDTNATAQDEGMDYDDYMYYDYPQSFQIVLLTVGTLMIGTSLYCLWLLLIILFHDNLRNQAYNIYLVLLIIPDMIVNGTFGIVELYLATNQGIYNIPVCLVPILALYFYYTVNIWMNGVVAYQIHKVVLNSYRCERTNPPTLQTVVFYQGLPVYLVGMIVSLFSIGIDTQWTLQRITNPWICERHNNLSGSTITILYGVLWWIPIVYVAYTYIDIRRHQLLPQDSDCTQALWIYFYRILIIFTLFYVPNIIMLVIHINTLEYDDDNYIVTFWLDTSFVTISMIQALVTIHYAQRKFDIERVIRKTNQSMIAFLKQYLCCGCRCCRRCDTEDTNLSSTDDTGIADNNNNNNNKQAEGVVNLGQQYVAHHHRVTMVGDQGDDMDCHPQRRNNNINNNNESTTLPDSTSFSFNHPQGW